MYCGERGIRTPGGVTLNGFQDRRIQPLCHLSKCTITIVFSIMRVQRYNFFFIPQRKKSFFFSFFFEEFIFHCISISYRFLIINLKNSFVFLFFFLTFVWF